MTTPIEKKLIEAATKARDHAYVPCSHYKVGVAVLTEGDNIVVGCNVENSKFLPIGTCGELTCLHSARAQGYKEFKMMAIVMENAQPPCGKCRETIQDHNPHMPLLVCDLQGNVVSRTNLKELMPVSFDINAE